MARGVTLEEMLEMLRQEAGHAPSTALGKNSASSLQRFLRRTQMFLWNDHYWKFLEVHRDINLAAGSRYYSFPDDLDGLRVQKMEVQYSSKWLHVDAGITTEQYNAFDPEADSRQDPVRRWDWKKDVEETDGTADPGLMFEVWPLPESSYDSTSRDGRIRFTGIRNLRPLIADSDRCDLDAELIVIYTAGKLLGRQKLADGTEAIEAAKSMYARMKGQGVKSGDRLILGGCPPLPQGARLIRNQYYSSGE